MAVVQISRIMHRRGNRVDLPNPLNDAELGWCEDTRQLFIGNGPVFGGNTEIITENTPASVLPYTYVSNTGTEAVTGFNPIGDPSQPDANYSTERTYQEKFDDIVSIKDYGALGTYSIGGGSGSDDTGALIRAMRDIYDESSGPNVVRRKRAIFFPAGVYRISQAFPLYPFCNLIGEGKGRTIIFLDFTLGINPAIGFTTGNDCVARTVDSKGQIAFNIGAGGPVSYPTNIFVDGITFQSNTPQTQVSGSVPSNSSVKEIIKLDRSSNVRFQNCEFVGSWTLSDPNTFNGSIGVVISRVTSPSVNMEHFSFFNCDFRNLVFGASILDTVYGIQFDHCLFGDDLYIPVKIGFDGTYDHTAGTHTMAGTGAPGQITVSNSRFEGYEQIGFYVAAGAGTGNISTHNYYADSGNNAALIFGVGTSNNVSLNDLFENTDPFGCTDKLTTLRARNLAGSNVIMNPQDQFQIPAGFCGDLTVAGDLVLSGSVVTSTPPSAPVGGVVATIPYADGNVIHFEYGMNEGGPAPNGVYRSGSMLIVTNGDPGATNPDDISFNHTYTELGGPPSNPITLSASLDAGNSQVTIDVSAGVLSPVFNYRIRVMTV